MGVLKCAKAFRWCELEHSLNRREQVSCHHSSDFEAALVNEDHPVSQVCWLQRFICVGHSAGIDQEAEDGVTILTELAGK